MKQAHNQALKYSEKDAIAFLDLIEIDKIRVKEEGLRTFVQLSWPVVQPGQGIQDEFGYWRPKWGWALDAVCDHYEAFIWGWIKRLLINVPPRSTKSTTGSVCAPVYGWTEQPELQFLTLAYRDDLATRDSVKSRRLINSKWFQDRWGDKFHLAGDQNQKTRYENNFGGHRIAQSVGSGSTGEGGDRIMVDDPHNTKTAESDQERQNVIDWWTEGIASRGNDPLESGRSITMQRLHERDLSGHVLASEADYVHLCLPLEYEVGTDISRKQTVYFVVQRKEIILPDGEVTQIEVRDKRTFKDPRTKEGDPLDPIRFSKKAIKELAKDMSLYAQAGQFQQRPAPRKGGMFAVEKIETVQVMPSQVIQLRYWDKQGTDSKTAKGRGAFTSGVLMGRIRGGIHKRKFIILDVIRGQWSAGPREAIIKNAATVDGKGTRVVVEQEPGSGGKESAESTVINLAGYRVRADRVTGDKVVRAEPFANQMDVGNVLMLEAGWNQKFIDELRLFPAGAQKDQVDAASGSFNMLIKGGGMGVTW